MIRILLVEDDLAKRGRIVDVLSHCGGLTPEAVYSVGDLVSAKQQLTLNAYDLVILDLVFPLRSGEDASANAGAELLESLFADETLKMPRYIVGLTAYDDAFARAAEKFESRTLTVIVYRDDDEWIEYLEARVAQIVASARSRSEDFDTTLGIVCALQAPELDAVRGLPWAWVAEPVADDHALYWRGQFESPGGRCSVIAVAASRMGMPAAAVAATKLITRFRPKYVAVTGICAGVKGRTKAGHVVVADPSWDYGSGKLTMRRGEAKFLPAPHQIALNVDLRSALERIRGDVAALAAVKAGFSGDRPDPELTVHIGPFASGAAVIADGVTTARVGEQHRQLLGIDMESYAVILSAIEAPKPQPIAISIKSVVDFADGKKGDEWQRYGAYASAQVLGLLATRFLR